jgi:hypothetical protein
MDQPLHFSPKDVSGADFHSSPPIFLIYLSWRFSCFQSETMENEGV